MFSYVKRKVEFPQSLGSCADIRSEGLVTRMVWKLIFQKKNSTISRDISMNSVIDESCNRTEQIDYKIKGQDYRPVSFIRKDLAFGHIYSVPG